MDTIKSNSINEDREIYEYGEKIGNIFDQSFKSYKEDMAIYYAALLWTCPIKFDENGIFYLTSEISAIEKMNINNQSSTKYIIQLGYIMDILDEATTKNDIIINTWYIMSWERQNITFLVDALDNFYPYDYPISSVSKIKSYLKIKEIRDIYSENSDTKREFIDIRLNVIKYILEDQALELLKIGYYMITEHGLFLIYNEEINKVEPNIIYKFPVISNTRGKRSINNHLLSVTLYLDIKNGLGIRPYKIYHNNFCELYIVEKLTKKEKTKLLPYCRCAYHSSNNYMRAKISPIPVSCIGTKAKNQDIIDKTRKYRKEYIDKIWNKIDKHIIPDLTNMVITYLNF